MSNNIYGIDFGTCNFKVFSKSSGKVISEKNTIAIINKTQIYAYGDDAYAMYEKAPESINVFRTKFAFIKKFKECTFFYIGNVCRYCDKKFCILYSSF